MTTALRRLTAFLAGCLLAAAPLAAQPITIVNPSFEDDVITYGAFVVIPGGPSGWTVYDPGSIIDDGANSVGVIAPNTGGEYFPGGATDGVNAALVYLDGALSGEAGLQQTLTATLQADTRYTLTVDIGNIASGTSLAGSTGGAGNFFDLDGFPGYRVELLAGDVLLASDNNSLGATIPEGEFRTSTVIFDTGAAHAQLGQSLTLRLINLDLPGIEGAPNIEVDFDNVSLLATAIPEPASLAMVAGFAVLAAVSVKRRRRRGVRPEQE